MLRSWFAALVASGLVASGVVQAPATAVAPQLVEVAKPIVYLSPDGDGRRDEARYSFDLAKRAHVTIRVERDGAVLSGPFRLGRLPAGQHHWTWDGRSADGSLVDDGTYDVRLRADRGTGHQTVRLFAKVDRTPDEGTLLVSRPTVYPKATAVDDHVLFTYLRQGWDPIEAAYPTDGSFDPLPPQRVHLFVLDSDGDRVHRDTVRSEITSVFGWDGTQGGKPVPAGTYTARVGVVDAAGNRSSYRQTFRVSHAQLVLETWSATVSAADALTYSVPTPPSCNGCGEGCSPVPSLRFVDGLSFPACTTYFYDAPTYRDFTMPVPFAAAPVDEYRVSATGGPTMPGGGDVGSLSGVTLGPGDATAWTSLGAVRLDATPYLPEQARAVRWRFSTQTGNSYDVASFTVEYRRYVPVP